MVKKLNPGNIKPEKPDPPRSRLILEYPTLWMLIKGLFVKPETEYHG